MEVTTNLINLDYLKLMSDGDSSMEQMMLDMLLEELPTEFEKMELSFATEQWEDLTKISHKMKSTLAFVGNEEVTKANLTIEELTKKGKTPSNEERLTIKSNMGKFGILLPFIMGELKKIASNY